MRARRLIQLAAFLGALTALTATVALSQASDGVLKTVSNSYIEIRYGLSGSASTADGNLNIGGHFGVWTTGGDPTTLNDNHLYLMDGMSGSYPVYSGLSVRVDDGAGGWKDYLFGDDSNGSWLLAPSVDDNTKRMRGIWKFKDVQVQVAMNLSLVRDTARFSFTATNVDTVPRKIGMRLVYAFKNDPGLNGRYVPSFVENAGRITTSRAWSGPDVPSFWRSFYPTNNPWYSSRAVMRGADATAPDRAAVTQLIPSSLWDMPVDPPQDLVEIGTILPCLVQWWDPRTLAPKDTVGKTIVSYYGLGCATENLEAPYTLAVQAPYTINYNPDSLAANGLTPNPITVTAYVNNRSALDFRNVNVWLQLPKGLYLAPGETDTKAMSLIPSQTENAVSWQVLLKTDNFQPGDVPSGLLKLTVGVSASPGVPARTVVREMAVSACNMHEYIPGWQMFTAPFEFKNSNPAYALGLDEGTFDIQEWDPARNGYVKAETLEPGKGYWLRSYFGMLGTLPLTDANARAVQPTESGQWQIQLHSGWNLVSSPYVTPYAWRNVLVSRGATADPVTMESALNTGVLRRTVFWWDSATSPGTGNYSWSSDVQQMRLMPWQSYWVKANEPCFLIMNQPMLGDWYGINAPM